jgi:hypothetical protein
MCRVNSQRANYRQHTIKTGNYIIDKHNIKTKTNYRQALVEENNNNNNNNNNKYIIIDSTNSVKILSQSEKVKYPYLQ